MILTDARADLFPLISYFGKVCKRMCSNYRQQFWFMCGIHFLIQTGMFYSTFEANQFTSHG